MARSQRDPHGSGFVNFVCPEDPTEAMFRCHSYRNSCSPWAVPDTAILPLAYWIGCTSITGEPWKNGHPQYIVVTKVLGHFTPSYLEEHRDGFFTFFGGTKMFLQAMWELFVEALG